jgi:hypothetical protein
MKVLLGGKELETWSKVPRQPKETLPRHAVPAKRETKGRTPITRGTKAYYGFSQGPINSLAVWCLKEATRTGGTRLATAEEERRILASARNANTTRR